MSSIQSFYHKDSTPSRSCKPHNPENEAFTQAEIEAARRPLTQSWRPKGVYEEVTIAELQPGPAKVRFKARIVNFSAATHGRGRGRSALPENFHTLIVKDDTGVVLLKLLSSGSDQDFLKLGTLVTVWTGFVADYSAAHVAYSNFRIPFVSLMISIHPSAGSTSCIRFHNESNPSQDTTELCRVPLNYDNFINLSQVPGLMSLKAYISSGYDDNQDAHILVCVFSAGPRLTVWSKDKQKDLELIEVRVFDETCNNCVLKLWEDKVSSAKSWVANQTILLITNPILKHSIRSNGLVELGIGSSSMVEVDPDFPDADWLRHMAAARTRKESVHIPFPVDIWDVDAAIHGPGRTLYTLADIDEYVREVPEVVFTGKLNLLITGVSIVEQCRKRQLCCFECCNIPLYSHNANATCKNCLKTHELSLNPKIIGSLTDETGSVAAGKLIWSDRAWTELLFGNNNTAPAEAVHTQATHVFSELADDSHADRGVVAVKNGDDNGDVSIKKEKSDSVEIEYEKHFLGDDIFDDLDDLDDPFDDLQPQEVVAKQSYESWKVLTRLDNDSLRDVEERLLYSRVTLTFGWSPRVGRLCVLGVEW
ncbi:hypothetical protein QC761_201950 [Podospora bellae-mahoneyi]|uniref:Replication factor A C-terminal domain-containing protein n=1 Tax=Podospora bellae-mahoneyi TaxID=2093777 RepID=A0ABR0FNF0_9PEZI|nr:hypothetical protein QC761_201950 [Podospora bellae-mahoneyi]